MRTDCTDIGLTLKGRKPTPNVSMKDKNLVLAPRAEGTYQVGPSWKPLSLEGKAAKLNLCPQGLGSLEVEEVDTGHPIREATGRLSPSVQQKK